jgi:hypothetical protein
VKKQKPKQKTKKKAKPASKAAKKPTKKIAVKASKPEETMDRASLKAIVSQLKEMGSDVKVFKSDTDEDLQKKVNEALQKMPTPDVLQKLESIVPDKLVNVLKRDCLGIFIDLSDVSCKQCGDSGVCAREFLKNLKDGLPIANAAMPAPAVAKKAAKTTITPVSRYEAERLVFVRDQPNPNPVGDPFHDTLQAVLDEQPSTMAELREIVERDFEIQGDGDFMKLVTSMRDPKEGVIKLDVDLTKKNKADLREAGVDV